MRSADRPRRVFPLARGRRRRRQAVPPRVGCGPQLSVRNTPKSEVCREPVSRRLSTPRHGGTTTLYTVRARISSRQRHDSQRYPSEEVENSFRSVSFLSHLYFVRVFPSHVTRSRGTVQRSTHLSGYLWPAHHGQLP